MVQENAIYLAQAIAFLWSFEGAVCTDRMEQENKKFDYAVLVMKLRESLGLTQFEFAELVNQPQSAISRIENGNANPTIKTLESIAKLSGKKLVMSFE